MCAFSHVHTHTQDNGRRKYSSLLWLIKRQLSAKLTMPRYIRGCLCTNVYMCDIGCGVCEVRLARVLDGRLACYLFCMICIHVRPELCWCITNCLMCEEWRWWNERLRIKWAISISISMPVSVSKSESYAGPPSIHPRSSLSSPFFLDFRSHVTLHIHAGGKKSNRGSCCSFIRCCCWLYTGTGCLCV